MEGGTQESRHDLSVPGAQNFSLKENHQYT